VTGIRKEPVTAPIIGATKITHLEDAIGALSVKLTQKTSHIWKSRMCRIASLAISKNGI
jgi:aryl-alcohol dehydrogenase-like predicted oxidoreductase